MSTQGTKQQKSVKVMKAKQRTKKTPLTDLLNSEGESDVASDVGDLVLEPSPGNLVALDCEMVGVGMNKQNALARCSIVDYRGNVLYDKHVKPKRKITDYRTKWSGIKPHHMNYAIPFKVARKEVLNILRNKVLVGHAIHFDLKILKIRESSYEIRDTSKNIDLRKLAGFSVKETPSLRRLSLAILGRSIQTDTHCSVEDSKAAMDLYRIVEDEWEKKSSKYLGDDFWPSWLETKS